MKYFPCYLIINEDKQIVAAIINEGINSKTKSKVIGSLIDSGFDVQNGTSLEASVMFGERIKTENLPLFNGTLKKGDRAFFYDNKHEKEEFIEVVGKTKGCYKVRYIGGDYPDVEQPFTIEKKEITRLPE